MTPQGILMLVLALLFLVAIIYVINWAKIPDPFRLLLIGLAIILFLCWAFGLLGGAPFGSPRRGG